jgi:hypothetical protein
MSTGQRLEEPLVLKHGDFGLAKVLESLETLCRAEGVVSPSDGLGVS